MGINRLGNHTGKTKYTTRARLADFNLNPFTFVGHRNNCFFLPYESLYYEGCATVPMVRLELWSPVIFPFICKTSSHFNPCQPQPKAAPKCLKSYSKILQKLLVNTAIFAFFLKTAAAGEAGVMQFQTTVFCFLY